MFSKTLKKRSQHLADLATQGLLFQDAYSEKGHAWKSDFLSTGKSVLRALGKELHFDEMKVTVNKAGPGVTGEVLLMGMWHSQKRGIYLDTSSPSMAYGYAGQQKPSFMWRTISHMEDYTGGANQWKSYQEFNDPDNLVQTLRQAVITPYL